MKIRFLLSLMTVMLSALLFSSCKKFLDEKARKDQVELKTLSDLQALLDYNNIMNVSPGFGESSADDYFVRLIDYNALFDDVGKKIYTWRLNDYEYSNDWNYCYNLIYSANYCLDYAQKIQKTTTNAAQWDNVQGSALFYRAFEFLGLIWDYGKVYDENSSQTDLGIVLRLTSDPTVPSKRSSVKETYDRVIMDAKESIQYLPDNPIHVMRPSKTAAYALLARTYLSMRKYDSAFKYSNLCLQLKNDLLDYNSSEVNTSATSQSPPFKPFNKEVIFYSTELNNFFTKNPNPALIDTVLYNSYDSADLRKNVFFYPINGYNAFKGTYSTVGTSSLFSGIATDEMYLTRAECFARASKVPESISDLNAVLIKRWKTGKFVPISAQSQLQALQIILFERRKELLMRGLRWIDVKRLNKESANITLKRNADQLYILPPNDDKYALPLPKDILNITGMSQNPGW